MSSLRKRGGSDVEKCVLKKFVLNCTKYDGMLSGRVHDSHRHFLYYFSLSNQSLLLK